MPKRLSLILTLFLLVALAACGVGDDFATVQKTVPDGDAEAGYQAILAYGCGSCHTIDGVNSATAHVGPPLTDYARRHYIAGNLPNTADNLIYWIRFPQTVEPGTAMPDMDVSEMDARNIAAYLYRQ